MRNAVIASLVVTSIALIASSSEAKPKSHHAAASTKTESSSATPNESLDEKAKWAKEDHYMERYVQAANVDCGITDKSKMITYNWDKETYRGQDWAVNSPNGYCQEVFSQISLLCRNVDGSKDAVQKGLKNVTCRYGGKGKFATSMSNKNFTVSFDWEQANMGDMIQQSLKKNL